MFYIIFSVCAALLDLRLKDGVESQPKGFFPRPLAGGRIILKRHHNPGVILNAGRNHPTAVRILTTGIFAAIVSCFAALLRNPGNHPAKFALSLIVGGSASNLWDRFRRGYVVDYFSFPLRRIRHIIFNLGDLFIFLGSALCAAVLLFSESR